MFATVAIEKGAWLCEYKGIVYPLSQKKGHEEEYVANKEGSYIIESHYPVPGEGRLCFDATRCYNQLGRYMNHAQQPNAALSKPFLVRGRWRVGFYAIRNIEVGHEVVWDYGVRWEEWSGSRLEKGVVVKGKKGRKEEVVGFNSPSVREYLSLNFFVKKTATCPILSDDDIRVTGKRKVGHKNDECKIL